MLNYKKYFFAYAAYTGTRTDFLNQIIEIEEPITEELIEKLQKSLKSVLNKNRNFNDEYFGVQIINFIKL
jgi:hypothetical protein